MMGELGALVSLALLVSQLIYHCAFALQWTTFLLWESLKAVFESHDGVHPHLSSVSTADESKYFTCKELSTGSRISK